MNPKDGVLVSEADLLMLLLKSKRVDELETSVSKLRSEAITLRASLVDIRNALKRSGMSLMGLMDNPQEDPDDLF